MQGHVKDGAGRNNYVVEEFTGEQDYDDDIELPHHEEGYASHYRFQGHVKDLIEVLLSSGNPFEEHSGDLVTLDSRVCESAATAVSVRKVVFLGRELYQTCLAVQQLQEKRA